MCIFVSAPPPNLIHKQAEAGQRMWMEVVPAHLNRSCPILLCCCCYLPTRSRPKRNSWAPSCPWIAMTIVTPLSKLPFSSFTQLRLHVALAFSRLLALPCQLFLLIFLLIVKALYCSLQPGDPAALQRNARIMHSS